MTFLEVIKSKYRKAVSFRHGASQQDIVASDKLLDSVDAPEEYPDTPYPLFSVNPLESGYFLDSITCRGQYQWN